jgi:hypothetical protein
MYQPPKLMIGQGSARFDRKLQILSGLFDAGNKSPKGSPWWGTYEIAKMIGLKPSQHLRGILRELYDEGVLLHQITNHRPNQYKDIWSLASNAPYSAKYNEYFVKNFEVTNVSP